MPDNDQGPEPTIFSAVITPHRSLGHAGFVTVMICVAAVSFVAGMVFLSIGAWPVFGFFGLDVLLIYLAFRASYRSAAAYEQVTITASTLHVRKVSHRGKAREWTLNPHWARIERESDEDFGLQRLFLVAHGRRVSVAGFLGPEEKTGFADALSAALGEARRGPLRTAV